MAKDPVDIGAFRVVSKSVVLLDPTQDYDESNEHHIALDKVANGRWMVVVTFVEQGPKAGQLEAMAAIHMKHIDRELDWDFDPRPIKTESGFIGLFDKDRQKKVETPFNWSLFPHAFLHRAQMGAGFYDFCTAKHQDRLVGFEIYLNDVGDSED